jgi:hypothetical protein
MGYGRLARVLVGMLFLLPPSVEAQELTPDDLINLFFDCQAPSCRDPDFFRRELPFVNWVVDREVADVHLLITSQQTGGGGRLYEMAFIGLRDFEGQEQELTLATSGDATTDEERQALAERARLGLVRYVQATSAADQLRVTFGTPGARGPDGGVGGAGGTTTAEDDPWNFWVFTLSGNAFLNGQATFKSSNLFGSFSAGRTTESWKYNVRVNYSENTQEFEFPDGSGGTTSVSETRQDWGTNGLVVRSLGARWAVGMRADIGSSTFFNQSLRWSVKPGLEFNAFPYSESSRRSLTVQYLLGPSYYEYNDTTIFGETEETRGQHSLTTRLQLVQPWGRWTTSITGQQYLHDTSKYSVSISGNVNIRLFRGFSIRLNGNYSWIRDQLFLAAEGATPEQVLLFQRQLGTNYRYFTSIGFEYRFGSIFNNVVNPRFGGNGGGFGFF